MRVHSRNLIHFSFLLLFFLAEMSDWGAQKVWTVIGDGVEARLVDGVPHAEYVTAVRFGGGKVVLYMHEGKLHCTDGPAVRYGEGCEDEQAVDEWWYKGLPAGPTLRNHVRITIGAVLPWHKTKGAVEYTNKSIRTTLTALDGNLHGEGKPAVVTKDEDGNVIMEMYYTNGLLDRTDGPAVVYHGYTAFASSEWWTAGKMDTTPTRAQRNYVGAIVNALVEKAAAAAKKAEELSVSGEGRSPPGGRSPHVEEIDEGAAESADGSIDGKKEEKA
jgi:hypothetical protein